MKPISVSQLNNYIKRVLASDPIIADLTVQGEVSDLVCHASGHMYFSLKDEASRIRCFVPFDRAKRLRFDISNGMEITVYGSVSVYEAGGTYSLNIRDIDVVGEGNLQIAFKNLKDRLEKEGLFDSSKKKPIPRNVKNVGVITSSTGAAIKDIITTITRRNPTVNILLYPSLVQGEDAEDSICRGIKTLNEKFSYLDVIIVGRGGGSTEDLWCFNSEAVAREIYKSDIPIISAVGHERDVVISDFAADLRAATPTAAAELAVEHIEDYKDRLSRVTPKLLYSYINNNISITEYKLKMLRIAIDSYNPSLVLENGYVMVYKDNKLVSEAASLSNGDNVVLKFSDGDICAVIKNE